VNPAPADGDDDGRARDRVALADLVASYARAADGRDFGALVELFTEGGVLAMHEGDPDTTEPVRVRNGRAEIAAAMETLRRYSVTHHMLGQHSAWFAATDRDRARGETYCLASHVRADKGAVVMRMMAIRYFDDYVGTGGEWRIARRRLAIDWIDEHSIG
jgi:hypothetical protein